MSGNPYRKWVVCRASQLLDKVSALPAEQRFKALLNFLDRDLSLGASSPTSLSGSFLLSQQFSVWDVYPIAMITCKGTPPRVEAVGYLELQAVKPWRYWGFEPHESF